MAKQAKERKTNALREIEAAGLDHRFITFDCEEALSGVDVAATLGEESGEHYVFMIPVACELDLKKAAATVDEKSIAMIKSKELLPLTGYIHGGCSPVGMKTKFRTCIDETAQLYDTIMFSGGRIGCQVEMAPVDLDALVNLTFADLTL